jgi:hypothetical protein
MDNKLKNKCGSVSTVSNLLRKMPVPELTEDRWSKIESSVYAALEKKPVRGIILHRENMFRSFYGPAIAAAAALILALSSVFYFNTNHFSNQQLSYNLNILDSKGSVSIFSKKGNQSSKFSGENELSLKHDESIKTGIDGELTVQIQNGTGFKMSPESELQILKSDDKTILISLVRGSALFSVKKRNPDASFIVRTHNAECSVKGTIFRVSIEHDGNNKNLNTCLSVFQGTVIFSDIEKQSVSTPVTAGQTTTISNHSLAAINPVRSDGKNIRDISLLTLTLESVEDSVSMPSGLVEIVSHPEGASVSVNGQIQGTTPIIMKLSEGTFNVEMSMPGYEPWYGNAKVQSRHTSIVSAALSQVKNKPDDASSGNIEGISGKNTQLPDNFVNRPEYVEALIQITIGEYQKALGILESLRKSRGLTVRERACILKQTSLCYRSLGDFEKALRNLRQRYEKADNDTEKASLLWEIANIQAACLGDYKKAEKTLSEYIQTYPLGQWVSDAKARLAEIRYLKN